MIVGYFLLAKRCTFLKMSTPNFFLLKITQSGWIYKGEYVFSVKIFLIMKLSKKYTIL